ncbi:MAG: antibiotic biosynthesis monooxygenase family protein [Propionibacteriaceae bacterium]
MVLEVALIDVIDPKAFQEAYLSARHVLITTPGCHTVRMTHGIENPSRFVLLVEWDSVEVHEQNFRQTERFATWRAAIGPHFAQPPLVEHFVDIGFP